MFKLSLFILPLLLIACQSKPKKKYSFGRMHEEGLAAKVVARGGTTIGPKLIKSSKKNYYFAKISGVKKKKEKDRYAILSQAGEYKVSFEFIETLSLDALNYKELSQPYFSWATEYVFPIKNTENFISLQHILVMSGKDEKGKEMPPHVIKHWRQDWSYQKPYYMDYKGHMVWKKELLSRPERSGVWTQEVYQVDDSPRYAAYGTWRHFPNYSIWTSNLSNRPLPRREFSVRSDYDVLKSVNRVTVYPYGWVHEQDNIKMKVDKNLKSTKAVARELGINRYQAIEGYDFSLAKEYWEKTSRYWNAVRKEWNKIMNKKKSLSLKLEVDGKKQFQRHFRFAYGLKTGKKKNLKEQEQQAASIIKDYLK